MRRPFSGPETLCGVRRALFPFELPLHFLSAGTSLFDGPLDLLGRLAGFLCLVADSRGAAHPQHARGPVCVPCLSAWPLLRSPVPNRMAPRQVIRATLVEKENPA